MECPKLYQKLPTATQTKMIDLFSNKNRLLHAITPFTIPHARCSRDQIR